MMQAEIWTNPKNARLHHGLGVALHAAGRHDEALVSFHKAWELEPGYNEPMNFIGVILKNKGDRQGAMAAYRKALSKTPEFDRSLFNLVSMLTMTRDADDTKKEAERERARGKPREKPREKRRRG